MFKIRFFFYAFWEILSSEGLISHKAEYFSFAPPSHLSIQDYQKLDSSISHPLSLSFCIMLSSVDLPLCFLTVFSIFSLIVYDNLTYWNGIEVGDVPAEELLFMEVEFKLVEAYTALTKHCFLSIIVKFKGNFIELVHADPTTVQIPVEVHAALDCGRGIFLYR